MAGFVQNTKKTCNTVATLTLCSVRQKNRLISHRPTFPTVPPRVFKPARRFVSHPNKIKTKIFFLLSYLPERLVELVYDDGDAPHPAEGHDGVVPPERPVRGEELEVPLEGLVRQEGLEVIPVFSHVLHGVPPQVEVEGGGARQLVRKGAEQAVAEMQTCTTRLMGQCCFLQSTFRK